MPAPSHLVWDESWTPPELSSLNCHWVQIFLIGYLVFSSEVTCCCCLPPCGRSECGRSGRLENFAQQTLVQIFFNRPWFRFSTDPELKEKPKLKNQKLKRLKGSPFFRFNDGFNGSTVQWWSQWFIGSNVQWFNDGLTPLPAQWWFPHPEPGPLHHCHFQPEYLRKSNNHLHHRQYHLYHWKL